MSESLLYKFNEALGNAANDYGLRGSEVNNLKKEFSSPVTEEEKDTERNSPKDYLIHSDDMKEIYLLVKNKKLSANKIKEKIKDHLKEPNELKAFLKSILDNKGKKSENKEAMGTGGGYAALDNTPLFSKKEFKEATSSSSVGQYDTNSFQDIKMKGNTPKGKGRSWRKTQLPGGKFVQVKKKCKRFPYCNQGDIKALNIWGESTTEKVIETMSKKYGLTENEIKEIISKEFRSNPKY